MMNNHNAKVIDELLRRIEEGLDNDTNIEELQNFYEWYVETFIK